MCSSDLFTDNFDGTLKEPMVMPTRVPLLLMNGSSGIAVGMATNVPPHNLGELCDAINYMIENFDNLDDISIDNLMNFVKGPDFPTGGVIMGREAIAQAYSTGRGKIVVRGRTHFEETRPRPLDRSGRHTSAVSRHLRPGRWGSRPREAAVSGCPPAQR